MSNHRKVAIFWDYENCSPPLNSQGHAIVNGIRRIAHVFGYVTSFKAYLDVSSQSTKSVGFRSDLQSSGVSMTDCPHNGRKDVVDKMILVDMLAFANDHPSPATIILIAGDRDYAYAISTLRLRQYNVILIVPPAPNIPQSLESQASVVVDWNFAILGKRTEAGTSPVRQPYRNLDEDIVERLLREVQDLNEDPIVTLISSSLPTPPAHIQRDVAAEQQQSSVTERNSGHGTQPESSCTPKKPASKIPVTPVLSRFGSAASRARFVTKSTQTVSDVDRSLGHSFKANDALSDECFTDDFVSITDEIQDASHDPFVTAPSSNSGLECSQNVAEPDSTLSMGLRNAPLSPSSIFSYNLDPRSASGSSSQTRIISGGTSVSYSNTSKNSVPAAVPLSRSTNVDPTSAMLDNCVVKSDKAAVKDALGYSGRDDDPISNSNPHELADVLPFATKVSNPSHAQVASSAESYHTTGDTYIVNSALINDSPPTPEPSVIPISPTSSLVSSSSMPSTPSTLSSLAPSSSSIISDSNVIVASDKIGSPQATSVITDNKDESSRCQSPPIGFESVEDKIRRLTPPKFLPLINQLLLARSKGILNPSRSDIANDLIRVDKDVYKRAGATKFADYASLAKEASVVEFGGGTTRSNSWITLHTRFRQELEAPKSSTPSIDYNNNPPTPQNDISGAKTSSTAPTPSSCPTSPLSPSPPPVVPIPPCFQPLIASLSKIHKNGLAKPFPSTVGLVIGPEIYSKAGASSLTEYFNQAVDAGVVQCGGSNGHAWVCLHPDVLSGKRSC